MPLIAGKFVNIVDIGEDKSSVLIETHGQHYRALVDSGAEISILNRKITECLPDTELLRSTEVTLRTATGSAITTVGEIDLRFKLGRKYLRHTFIVAENLSQSVILGRDCLKAHKMKLDFGKNQLLLQGDTVPLEADAYLDSLVRVANQRTLKPQTSTIIWGKFKGQKKLDRRTLCSISGINTGFTRLEPGLMVTNSVSKIVKQKKFPILVCNNTDKTMRLNKGNVIAKVEVVQGDITPISEVVDNIANNTGEAVDIEKVSVPEEYRAQMEKLLRDNEDLFAATDLELGRTDAIKMKIDTGDHPPIRVKPYRTPLNKRPVVDKAIEDMLVADIIRPSRSCWSFPIIIIGKKDGGQRFCVDFRKLNQITKNYVWPLPHIDDILCSMGKSIVFTSLDLKSGFWQVPVEEEDRKKTAFSCHKGLYEFNSMPFGLSTAPSVFQELMNHVLEGIGGFATAYLDDVIIHSATDEEHLQHIQKVFDRLRQFGLKMKMSKCTFMKNQINYLGFLVGANGIQVDPKKIRAIQEMIPPTDVRGVRAFHGCTSYYRRFCPGFSKVASPLIALTKKHARFDWSEECQQAFETLKRLLMEAPALTFPDPSLEYTLYTDASGGCIGAVLVQDQGNGEQPIHYLSHKLSGSQKNWPIIQKECFSIVYALEKLDHYLHGASFTVKCDHKPLKYLLSSEMKNSQIQTWALKISGYNCKIEYIKGKDNEQADMLSRLDHGELADEITPKDVGVINSNRVAATKSSSMDSTGKQLPVVEKVELPDMEIEQNSDTELRKIKNTLDNPMTSAAVKRKYAVVDGLLYYVGHEEEDEPAMRLMIPSKYRGKVLEQYHDNCAHWGIDKTFGLIKRNYHWIGLYRDVLEHVTRCITCRVRSMKKQISPLQEMEEVMYPFQKIGVDMCGPYPESITGAKYILTVVDQYSGWAEAFAVANKKTETIVRIMIDEIFPRYSCPDRIVSDNGGEFKSQVFADMCHRLNITQIFTSPYHPAGNGKTERFHRVMNDMLSKKTARHLELWDQHLPAILAAYRVGISETTGYSPFFLLYTRDPVLPLDNLLKPRRRYLGEDYHQIALERQHEAFMAVRRNLRKARHKQKKYHDRKAKDLNLSVGDPVYVHNNNRQSKLEDRWVSHYRVMQKNSPVTYTVRNQLTGDVRRVHVEQLRLADLGDWPMPAPRQGARKTRYVVPPSAEDSEDSEATYPYVTAESSDPDDDVPLAQLRRRWEDTE